MASYAPPPLGAALASRAPHAASLREADPQVCPRPRPRRREAAILAVAMPEPQRARVYIPIRDLDLGKMLGVCRAVSDHPIGLTTPCVPAAGRSGLKAARYILLNHAHSSI
jgi:hypothetical protein